MASPSRSDRRSRSVRHPSRAGPPGARLPGDPRRGDRRRLDGGVARPRRSAARRRTAAVERRCRRRPGDDAHPAGACRGDAGSHHPRRVVRGRRARRCAAGHPEPAPRRAVPALRRSDRPVVGRGDHPPAGARAARPPRWFGGRPSTTRSSLGRKPDAAAARVDERAHLVAARGRRRTCRAPTSSSAPRGG